MARRRRRSFHRVTPDRGWLVGTAETQINYSATAVIASTLLFDFLDMDSDPQPIAKEKSDWFIKRFIIDSYASYGPASGGVIGTDTARLWQVAYGSIQTQNTTVLASLDPIVWDPTTWELHKRLFRTYTRPVYATWAPALESATGDLLTDGAAAARAFSVSDSPWGQAAINDDFEVSNAGLAELDGVYATVSCSPGPGSFDWDNGDMLFVRHYYKCLLQKRRG